MAAAADVVGKQNLAAVAPMFLAIAGFDLEDAGKHEEKLAPGGRMPVLIEALGHVGNHCALRSQDCGAVDGIAKTIGRRIVDRDIDLDKIATRHLMQQQSERFSSDPPKWRAVRRYNRRQL